jgi:hypothetical protein
VWRGRKYENIDLYAGIREDQEIQKFPEKSPERKKPKLIKIIANYRKRSEKQ